MNARLMLSSGSAYRLFTLLMLVFLATMLTFGQSKVKRAPAKAVKSDATGTVDPKLVGVWGVDERGGYDFRANGTFVMEGAATYRYDASGGVWHYWLPSMPAAKTAADYKLSADGKSLSINLKAGKPMTNLKRVKASG